MEWAEYRDRKVLVVGLGIQGGGVGVAKFFAQLGSHVTVTDKKSREELASSIEQLKDFNINYALGEHKVEDFAGSDIIFKGPSVPWDLPEIKQAEEKGIPIEMEASFFAAYSPAQLIGVTGTRGKTTTAYLIYEALKAQGKSVHLAGNIPNQSTIDLLNKINQEDIVVLELSSWQLSGFHRKKLSPHIGVFTNLYEDHLNYYKSIEDYLHDKKAIYLYQKENDILIANENLKTEIEKDNSRGRIIYFNKDFTDSLLLKGEHNIYNASAAYKVCEVLDLDLDKTKEAISNFKGLPYRQEKVAEKNDITFVNDSASTTPVAAVAAINTFSDKPIVLILGGNSKNLHYDELLKALDNVERIVLLKGSFTDEIMDKLDKSKIAGPFDSLEDVVHEAAKSAKGKYLLFSPGATSFAMFKNEFDRGDKFNLIVDAL